MANLARRRSGIVVDGALETIVATQLTNVTESFAISDTLPVAVPIGPQAMLRIALAFTGLIGGTIANTATIIRFNRRRGLDAPTAVSSWGDLQRLGLHRPIGDPHRILRCLPT
jgi:hypothetical protein